MEISEDERQLNVLVRNTAKLLSAATVLEVLHLSLPRLGSAIPFLMPIVTSLTIPTAYSLDHNDAKFEKLLRLFQLPFLKDVELDSMLLNCIIPKTCHQTGISNVKNMVFNSCGPLNKETSYLLRWPRDLQTLRFSVADKHLDFRYECGYFSHLGLMDALQPLKGTLQDLHIDLIQYDTVTDDPLQTDAFKPFTKLKRLHLPLTVLMEFSEEYESPPPFENIPPIHTRLPPSLEELSVDLVVGFQWLEEDGNHIPRNEVKELFAWLQGLAEHKTSCFPLLRQVSICGVHEFDFPLGAVFIQRFRELMLLKEISMVIHYY